MFCSPELKKNNNFLKATIPLCYAHWNKFYMSFLLLICLFSIDFSPELPEGKGEIWPSPLHCFETTRTWLPWHVHFQFPSEYHRQQSPSTSNKLKPDKTGIRGRYAGLGAQVSHNSETSKFGNVGMNRREKRFYRKIPTLAQASEVNYRNSGLLLLMGLPLNLQG